MLVNKTYLAIEVGKDKLRVTHLKKSKNKVRIKQSTQLLLAEGSIEEGQINKVEEVSQHLGKWLKAKKILTKDVIFSIYHSRIITREVTLPLLAPSKIQKLIHANVQDYFPVDLTGYLVGHRVNEIIVENQIKKAKVLLIAVPEKILTEYTILCQLLKLDLVGIDYQESSILRFVTLQKLPETALVIHLGEEATTVVIQQGDKNVFNKTMPIGMLQLVQALKNQYRVTYEEAAKMLVEQNLLQHHSTESFDLNHYLKNTLDQMLNSISGYLKYYHSREGATTIDRIYIVGEGTAIQQLDHYVQEALALPTQYLREIKGVVFKQKSEMLDGIQALALTVGMAFYDFNLLPEGVLNHRKQREKTRLIVLLSILVFLSCASILLIPLGEWGELEREKKELNEQVEVFKEIEAMHQRYEQLVKDYDVRQQLMDEATTKSNQLLVFLEYLEEAMPTGVVIQGLTSTQTEIIMQCSAENRVMVAQYLSTLKALGLFQKVSTASLNEVPGPNPQESVIQFTVSCQY